MSHKRKQGSGLLKKEQRIVFCIYRFTVKLGLCCGDMGSHFFLVQGSIQQQTNSLIYILAPSNCGKRINVVKFCVLWSRDLMFPRFEV